MLHQLLSTFRGRKLQAYQVSQWRRVKLSNVSTADCVAISRACTCLFTVAEDAIEDLFPREAGALIAILCQTAEVLVFILSEDPPFADINALCREFREHIAKRFPDVDICTTSVRELAALVLTMLDAERECNPGFVTAIQSLRSRPNNSEETLGQVLDILTRVVKRINRALFQGLLPKLRIEYSFTEMTAFSRAYRRQDRGYDADFPRMSVSSIELEVDDTESEYKGAGERVGLFTFCKFAELIPGRTECCICVTQFDDTEEAVDMLPVITKCGHFYHKVCLDTWVNDSAMKASNTCPSCRTELCKPRERLHESLEDTHVFEADDENDNSTAGSVAAVLSWSYLQRLHARIVTHLSFGSDHPLVDEVSDIDGSSISSGESDGGVVSRRMLETMRAERRN